MFWGRTQIWGHDTNMQIFLEIRIQLLMLFSHSVMSNSLWSHGLQRASPLCPSPFPGVCSNSCPLNWWCFLTISFSVALFSSCPQSFPSSGSFPMSGLFASGGRSIGASASVSVLPMSIQGWLVAAIRVVYCPNQYTSKKEKGETDRFLFSWASISLQMMTAALKLKDTCSLEGKLLQTETVY